MQTHLIWLRGSGKTELLKTLCSTFKLSGIDLDDAVLEEIRKIYGRVRSIDDFVNGIGSWPLFRDIEHTQVWKLVSNDTLDILAYGGWTAAFHRNRHVIDPVDTYALSPHHSEDARIWIMERVFNRENLPKKSTRILLDVSVEEQIKRLTAEGATGNENRLDLWKDLQDTYDHRIGIYRDFSDIIISVDGKSIDEIREEILWYEQIKQALKKAV